MSVVAGTDLIVRVAGGGRDQEAGDGADDYDG
jgi:hypothetical protein